MTSHSRICIIGAGPSGIAAAKNCLQAGLAVAVFDRGERVGGNWVYSDSPGHSSVYATTHIISSKALSQYEDYPMPADYPDYPSHRLLQRYFENYARDFGVLPHIRFGHTVEGATPVAGGGWLVRVRDQQGVVGEQHFSHLMVANGHHHDPQLPEIPGGFSGRYCHSHEFKRADESFRGQRVLVIGAGNSACDIAVETARVSAKTCIAMRSGQWFVPKFMFGLPTDVFAARTGWLPPRLQQWLSAQTLRLLTGGNRAYGLPEPSTPLFTQHPTINSELMYFIRHGEIEPRPGVARFDGSLVEFSDGRREEFEIVIAATGYWTTFPFFDEQLISFKHSLRIPLYKKMMHAEHASLYFIGLFQPLGCIWPLADYQARLAVAEITGAYRRPADMRAAIQHELDHPHYAFRPSVRHAVEVDYHRFRRELLRELGAAHPARAQPAR
ncbi:MAG: NAD(P)-binding domain-containing protein [Roseiflexaceae bacterium]|nr:NAD(P)-binding domain-containing protein [Roseiflexaceae bacterium]